MDIANAVLDHCHGHGGIRATLGRWNNGVLGKIENWANRLGADPATGQRLEPWVYLRNIADYLEKHATPQFKYSHPTHKTEREKMDLKNKRARNARAKAAKEKRLAAKSD
ncbi:endonuclease VII [Ralstonia phage RSJ2]|uniref:Putative DNA endonuclease n=1 Tax=Ralstonia phage RSJ2 TaxID=1481785 RepID=A0A068Q6G9_9CAUD|nr:endonuclease VII [Ralstonia phage RSJ2]BAP15827.1 putative DNA endonuclease [Ralstonia phage RSJ2]